MAGMSLRTGISAGGSYSPMTPASATPPSSRSTIAQAAYGISGSGLGSGPRTAGFGSTAVGMVAIASLVFIWWSLPR
jgi:hypothetical protein